MIAINRQYLNPGILVVGEVQMRGCITYQQFGYSEQNGGKTLEADWQTHKRIEDIEEQRRLATTRANLTNKLRRIGVTLSGMGTLVPLDRSRDLEAILEDIRAEILRYNENATCTRLSAYFACFTIAGTDEAIARALYDRATSVLDTIADCMTRGDVKGLRAAIRDLSGMDTILPSESAKGVSDLIEDARKRARAATKAAKELVGETAIETVRSVLRGIPVDGLRAGLVETGPADNGATPIVPIDARIID